MAQAPGPSVTSWVERRAIGYIPEAERHGSLFSQFTLWLAANLQITAIVTGALAVVLGGDVWGSLLGLLIGQCLGGVVMALHAAQGPRLGLPQMISSRAQFGVYGAAIPIALVCLMYVGFSAAGCVLVGQALSQLLGIDARLGMLLFAVLIVLLALCGYRAIHRLGRLASVVGVLAFAYLFVALLAGHDLAALRTLRPAAPGSFLLAISLAASWQIAYGPYVADYSRYLPRQTSQRRVFAAVWLGSVLGTQAAMSLGVVAAALAGKRFAGHEVAYIVGLGGTGMAAAGLYASIAFGKLTITALNAYGGCMSLLTIGSGFRGGREATRGQRLFGVLALVAVSTALAMAGAHAFLAAFESFILLLLTFLTPWSAINLVDFYAITRERLDVPALFDPAGRYGRWNPRGIGVYVAGVLAQLPFIDSRFYSGPLLKYFGGADVSWIVGLLVPGLLYFLLARRQAPASLILPGDHP